MCLSRTFFLYDVQYARFGNKFCICAMNISAVKASFFFLSLMCVAGNLYAYMHVSRRVYKDKQMPTIIINFYHRREMVKKTDMENGKKLLLFEYKCHDFY